MTSKSKYWACAFFACVLFHAQAGPADEETAIEELKRVINEQKLINDQQQKVIQQQESVNQQQEAAIRKFMDKIAELEGRIEIKTAAQTPPSGPGPAHVSLQEDEAASLAAEPASSGHVLAKPWYDNIILDGFGAAGFVWTGGNAARQKGGFLNYEATLNFDARVWEDVHFFHELQTIRLGDENTKFVRTGEVYVMLKDVFKTLFDAEGRRVGAKIGRMDIPFGEDYLTQDVIDNPLITLAAAYPYGWDEGLVLYSRNENLNWVAAVMDGSDTRGSDDTTDKFLSLKLYGNATERLYLSGSILRSGRTAESAWEFGGSHLVPVGSGGLNSALGRSGSGSVNAYSYELDARYSLGDDRYLKGQFGYAFLDDDHSEFDRNIYYFQIEPKWNWGPRFDNKWYWAGRLSAIGTFNDDKGFAFDGKPYAGGKTAFGYDTEALYRYAIGLGFKPNPRTLIKMEYSRDDFRLIRSSSKDGGSEGRDLAGIITTVKF